MIQGHGVQTSDISDCVQWLIRKHWLLTVIIRYISYKAHFKADWVVVFVAGPQVWEEDAMFDSWHKDPNQFWKEFLSATFLVAQTPSRRLTADPFPRNHGKAVNRSKVPTLGEKGSLVGGAPQQMMGKHFLHLVVKGENDKSLYVHPRRSTDYEKDECDVMGVASRTEQLSLESYRVSL